MELLLNSIPETDWEGLKMKCGWIAIIATCVLVAMIVDLIAGVRKARQRGSGITSDELKRTVDKSVRYFRLIILCSLLDVIVHLITPIPYFSIVAGLFLVVIEIMSWFEKADKKERKNAEILAELLRNKDDLVKGFAEVITKQLNENEDTKRDQE